MRAGDLNPTVIGPGQSPDTRTAKLIRPFSGVIGALVPLTSPRG